MAREKLQKSSVTTSPAQARFQAPRPFSQPCSADIQDAHQASIQRSTSNSNRLERVSVYPPTSAPPILQPKLTVGAPSDRYEKEALQVAHQVVTKIHSPAFQAPQPQLKESIQRQTGPRIGIRRKPTIQGQATEVIPDLEASIQAARSSGRPIKPSMKEPMEQAFGSDFSQVRIHTDTQSDQLNRSIQAKAFTTGQDIFFRSGEYKPDSRAGQELMAHELTHVVQQTGRVEPTIATEKLLGRESIPSVQRKCAGCEAEEKKQGKKIQKKAISSGDQQVQRSIFDVLTNAIDELFNKNTDDNEMQAFPPCENSSPTLPSLDRWLDNSALESIRHNNKVLSQSKSPGGDSKAATGLVQQLLLSWGCNFYNQNFLPKFGVNCTFGAETKTAVKQFQTYFSLNVDGAIGSTTLQAMDVYMGVSRPSQPITPSEVGGDEVQGKSRFNRGKNPVAQIYFATNDSQLDSQDRGVLTLLANALDGSESVSINFYGYSDKCEAVDYNLQLADFRTASVSSVFQSMLDERNVNDYDVLDIPLGEIERPQNGTTAEELKPFRRVDIEIQELKWPEIDEPSVCTDLLCIPDKPSKPGETNAPHQSIFSEKVYVVETDTDLGGPYAGGNFDFSVDSDAGEATVTLKVVIDFSRSNFTKEQKSQFRADLQNAMDGWDQAATVQLEDPNTGEVKDFALRFKLTTLSKGRYNKKIDVFNPQDNERLAWVAVDKNREIVLTDINVLSDSGSKTLTHELGHAFALEDEYDLDVWKGSFDPFNSSAWSAYGQGYLPSSSRTLWEAITNTPSSTESDINSLMNNGIEVRERYFTHFKERILEEYESRTGLELNANVILNKKVFK